MTQHQHAAASPSRVLEVEFKNCFDAGEYAELENNLAQQPGIHHAHLDRTRGVAHLEYDPAVVTEATLKKRLHTAGYDCACQDCAPSQI